jgi:organic solute transporter subunit alpha
VCRKVYRCLNILVIQVALIRPLLLFIAAVLWSDGLYTPGLVSNNSGYAWLVVVTRGQY